MTNISTANIYKPIFYRIYNPDENEKFQKTTQIPAIRILDTLKEQLKELIKLRNPAKKLTNEEYEQQLVPLLGNKTIEEYGVWVFYEWNHTLVHTLDEAEFIEVRTSRNQYKITQQERDMLATKKIGVVGLSVGQSIALTLAIERVCGEIRLADFDTLELSNLNRIRSGIHNLGVPKVIIAAREIAEIDPYLHVTLFPEGITDENIDAFFGTGNARLDILVEVCDGLDIKIKSRHKARELKIPVVMDTNDKGMVDIERFDLEPDRPILHGLAGDLNPDNIKGLTNEEKIPYILKMIGAGQISTRLKASMLEVEQTLNTWPQLASSVQLGGAATTDICRRILLKQLNVSGRFYIDLEELVKDPTPNPRIKETYKNPFHPLTATLIESITDTYIADHPHSVNAIPFETISVIVQAACGSPSAGNNQPWKWRYKDGRLLLLHDRHRSWSWGDYAEMGSLMSLGCALETVTLKSAELGLQAAIQMIEDPGAYLVAEVDFTTGFSAPANILTLASGLNIRQTNRKNAEKITISPDIISCIEHEVSNIPGMQFFFTSDETQLTQLGKILASCDRIRLLHELGHEEFYHEIRWSKEEALQKRDGIELSSVNLTESEKAGFFVANDYNAVKFLKEMNLGSGFKRLSTKSIQYASGIGIICADGFNRNNLLNAGSAVMRAWITTNLNNLAFYPMLSAPFFFNRLIHGKGVDIPEQFVGELTELRETFLKIFPLKDNLAEVFLFRLSKQEETSPKTQRLDIKDTFYY